MEKEITISCECPGKILICGGYLILDPRYKGLSLAVNSYFQTNIKLSNIIDYDHSLKNISKNILDENSKSIYLTFNIKVKSVNYNISYDYQIALEITIHNTDKDFRSISSLRITKFFDKNNNTENNFIQASLYSSLVIYILSNKILFVDINGDTEKEYYMEIELIGSNKFYLSEDYIIKDHSIKSGLGSSSALISSLCFSFYYLLEKIFKNNKTIDDNLDELKIISCYASLHANWIASGKIGSGFDIMTCYKGSIIFSQFSSNESFYLNTIYTYYNEFFNISKSNSSNISNIALNLDIYKNFLRFNEYYRSITNYNNEFILKNEFIRIKLYCVTNDSGSNTRIFSKNVVNYINDNNGFYGNYLVRDINLVNTEIINLFKILNDTNKHELFILLKEKNIELRKLLRLLSVKANVDIEPENRTQLLDNIIELKECFFSIIPGAGGYDGFCALYLDDGEHNPNLEIPDNKNHKKNNNSNKSKLENISLDKNESIFVCDLKFSDGIRLLNLN